MSQLQTTLLTPSDLSGEQLAAIDRLYDYDETLLIGKVGFGKAIVGLTAAQELVQAGAVKRLVVFAPLQVCRLTWSPEPHKWSHIKSELVAVACGTVKQRDAAMALGTPIVVTNFDNIPWLVDNYGDEFDAMLIDEITKLKTVGGAQARKLRNWTKGLTWRAGMTGTPVAEAGDDIYGQALLLDGGRALGTRKITFQKQHMYPLDHEARRWAFTDAGREYVVNRLRGLVYTADTSLYEASLPPVDAEYVPVKLPFSVSLFYRDMRKDSVVCALDSDLQIIAGSEAVKAGKLQQLAAGGLYDNEGELFSFSPFKIDALCEWLVGYDSPVAIMYQYQFELNFLRERFPDAPTLGKGFGQDELDAWSRGEIPVVLMHPKSASHGLNLQYGGCTLIQLSPLWSADNDQQIIGRFQRRGQPSPVVKRIVFVAVDTVDETMVNRIEEKSGEETKTMEQLK